MKVVLSATMSGEDFSDSSVLLHASVKYIYNTYAGGLKISWQETRNIHVFHQRLSSQKYHNIPVTRDTSTLLKILSQR